MLCLCCLNTAAWAQTQRRVLLEVFSTEQCNQCPLAHSNIERIFGNGGDSIVIIGHHAGFYTDDLTIPESIEYEWFYSPDRGLYAPAAMMNRNYDPHDKSNTFTDGVPVFDGSSARKLQSAYAAAINTPLSVKVELSTEYEAESRELDIAVTSSLLRKLPNAANLRINVFLTEDSIFTALQSGAYGSYYHRHSARQCLTGTWGESIDLSQAVTSNYHVVIPEEWNAGQIQVVAFVSSYDEHDRCNCPIYNTAAQYIARHGTDGITAVHADKQHAESVYNILGQRVSAYSHHGISIQRGKITTIF